jgi:hypothetical protein
MAAPLAKKLQLRPGQRIAVVGAPADAERLLDALPRDDAAPNLLAFVRTAADVAGRADQLARAARDAAGLAWAAYPKRSSGVETDLTRDRGWDALTGVGLRPVRQVALDDTWSALRFRRSEDVG